jgi:hypothetical protein
MYRLVAMPELWFRDPNTDQWRRNHFPALMKRSRNNGGLAALLLIKRGYDGLTAADGRVGINLTDGSSFNLSNNARMALDEFVYDPNGTSNSTLFN